MAFLTGAELSTFCGGASGETALFTAFADEVTHAVEQYIGRGGIRGYLTTGTTLVRLPALETTDSTEWYNGTGDSIILCRRRPITAITAIYEETATTVWTEITAAWYQSIGMDAEGGIIQFIPDYGQTMTIGRNNWKIRYTAGYTCSGGSEDRPDDLLLACKLWGQAIYERKKQGVTLASFSLGPQSSSKSFTRESMPAEVVDLLAPWKPFGVTAI